ncbi:MAG: hypothetical protein PHO87_04895 [Acholeplasmataceae bacterium]|nr:hypothetical protein [Acholeplasmataceae bacterium]
MAYVWNASGKFYIGLTSDTRPDYTDIGAILHEIDLVNGIRKTYQTHDRGSTWTEISNGSLTPNTEGTLHAIAPTKANTVGGVYMATPPTYNDGDLTVLRTNVNGDQVVQVSGSNVEQTNGGNIALKSNLVAGKSPTGKQRPLNVDEYGMLHNSYSVITTGNSLTNAVADGTGNVINCIGGLSARMIVTGVFNATVLLDVKINGAWGNYLPLYIQTGENRGRYIISADVYYADIPIGATEIKAYVSNYVSGSISAVIDVMTVPFISQYFKKSKNVLLAINTGFAVASGATTRVTFTGRRYDAINISDFPYQYVVVKGNTATTINSYNVYFSYFNSEKFSSLGAVLPNIEVIDSATATGDITRTCSEWIEAMGSDVSVYIKNNDSAERTFIVCLYGVR